MHLRPKRSIEHIIEVKSRSKPIKVKPYQYSHNQKIEVEILVQDLLKRGVITKSIIPYVAPVLLV